MRSLITAILIEIVLSVLLPGSIVSYVIPLLLLFFIFLFLKREALVLAPLLLAVPLAVAMLPTVLTRFSVAFLLAALLFLAVSDIESRQRGAPLLFTRLLLWYLAGAAALFATFFTAVGDHVVPVWLLLFGSIALGIGGIYLARDAVERSRGAKQPAFPVLADAVAVGFLMAESVIALAFLPFSPFTLAALSTIILWFLVRTIVAHRFGVLSSSRLFKFSVSAFTVSLLVVVPAFFV